MKCKNFFIIVVAFYTFCCHVGAEVPKVLYSSFNNFGSMWVYETSGRRCLSFLPPEKEEAQSCIFIKDPELMVFDYTKMLLGALYINKNPQKILIIGLGGAILPNAINKLIPKVGLDIVEINTDVIKVAEEFFFFNITENMQIFIEDGYEYIKNSNLNKYDIILIDAFNKDYVPPSFLTLEFVRNIKRSLKPFGVVAINTYNDGLLKEYDNYNKIESNLYKEVFGDFVKLISFPSRIILAQKNCILPELDKMQQNSQFWHNKFKLINVDSIWLVNKFIKNDSRS